MSATIKDVAQLAGVSVGTVSRFLNGYNVTDKNRVKIEQAIKQLNFKINPVARSLKTNRSMTVAILVPALANIFSMRIIEAIEQYFDKYGYSIIVCDSEADVKKEKEKLQFLKDKHVDGVIIMPSSNTGKHIPEILKDVPAILIDRVVDDVKLDAVIVDNINATYQSVEQLIIRGHRNIGIIAGPPNISTARERYEGYRRVLNDYNIKINEQFITYGDYTVDTGYKLMKAMMNLDQKPTAIFISNYEMTIGAVMAINEMDIKVPDQLSIIGFDQLELSKVIKPSLSVVVQPMEEIGYKAADILYKRMKGEKKDFPTLIRLKTYLSEGDSISNLF